jgi:hypothetical protein
MEDKLTEFEHKLLRLVDIGGDDMNVVTKTCGESSLRQSDFPETNLKDLIEGE